MKPDRLLIAAFAALALAGCSDRSVEFEPIQCTVEETGAVGQRTYTTCGSYIRGVCMSQIPHRVKTKEVRVACRKTEWVDR